MSRRPASECLAQGTLYVTGGQGMNVVDLAGDLLAEIEAAQDETPRSAAVVNERSEHAEEVGSSLHLVDHDGLAG